MCNSRHAGRQAGWQAGRWWLRFRLVRGGPQGVWYFGRCFVFFISLWAVSRRSFGVLFCRLAVMLSDGSVLGGYWSDEIRFYFSDTFWLSLMIFAFVRDMLHVCLRRV